MRCTLVGLTPIGVRQIFAQYLCRGCRSWVFLQDCPDLYAGRLGLLSRITDGLLYKISGQDIAPPSPRRSPGICAASPRKTLHLFTIAVSVAEVSGSPRHAKQGVWTCLDVRRGTASMHGKG